MKIVVTGNLGYVGSNVMRHLRACWPQSTLVGLDIGLFAGCVTHADMLPECLFDHQYFCDVRNVDAAFFADVDYVVHLAGVSNDPIGKLFEQLTYEINYKGSLSLAAKARQAGVKGFIFASSCSIYGHADSEPRTESCDLAPLTAYARSKVLAEQDLALLADKNFQVTCLRFSTACGMSDRLRLDLVLNDFVAAAVAGGMITILSDGTPWRPLINTHDMARAISWAIGREAPPSSPFLAINIGSSEWNCQVKDLAVAVARLIPGTRVEINAQAAPDKRSYQVNFDLFRRLAPNHQPENTLDATILELKNGLEQMQFNDGNFRAGSRYIRLNTIQRLLDKQLLTRNLEWCRI